jgi:phage shock protein A
MALITRLTRLFRADLHAVLDRIEEPDLLLKQAVREMEEALAGEAQRLRTLTQERDQLLARVADLAQSQAAIEAELDLCFAAGKEDLARALIRRQLEAERLRKALERKGDALGASLGALQARVAENSARLEAMRQQAALLGEGAEARRPDEGWPVPDLAVREEEVDVAFLREQQKRRRP